MTKNSLRFSIFTAVAISLFTGCADSSVPQNPNVRQSGSLTPPKDKGLVIIYAVADVKPAPDIYGNDQFIAMLRPHSFYTDICDPGSLRLSSGFRGNGWGLDTDLKRDWVTINVTAGKTSYVAARMGWREWLEQVPDSQAEQELKQCAWLNPTSR